jgi:hypothetical protein
MVVFVHFSQEDICPKGRFGGYPATSFGLADFQSTEVVVEVNDNVYIPTLLATLADYMVQWGDYKRVINAKELKDYLNKLISHYICEIEDYFRKDDWDDYFILLLQAHKVLSDKSNWFVDCNLYHYNQFNK